MKTKLETLTRERNAKRQSKVEFNERQDVALELFELEEGVDVLQVVELSAHIDDRHTAAIRDVVEIFPVLGEPLVQHLSHHHIVQLIISLDHPADYWLGDLNQILAREERWSAQIMLKDLIAAIVIHDLLGEVFVHARLDEDVQIISLCSSCCCCCCCCTRRGGKAEGRDLGHGSFFRSFAIQPALEEEVLHIQVIRDHHVEQLHLLSPAADTPGLEMLCVFLDLLFRIEHMMKPSLYGGLGLGGEEVRGLG
jgi:hypothetical protein